MDRELCFKITFIMVWPANQPTNRLNRVMAFVLCCCVWGPLTVVLSMVISRKKKKIKQTKMADDDEIDVLGDFSFNSCLAQNNQGM